MRYSGINTQEARLGLILVFALAVLIFSVTRGLVPILTEDASLAEPTYYTATLLGVVLSCYGLYRALFTNSRTIGKWPYRLLIINFLLYLIWLIPVVIFRPKPDFLLSIIYSGLFPFSIYALVKIPEKLLIPVLGFLTLVVSAFIILEFIELNTFLIPNGYAHAFERQTLLRPGLFEAFSKNGNLIRPNGLFGFRPHDSGNILAILFTYWFAMVLRAECYKILASAIAIVALISLLFTQSAGNIIASFVGVAFVLIANLKGTSLRAYSFRLSILLVPLIVILWVLIQHGVSLEMLWRWSRRVSSEYGDWRGMTAFGISTGDWLGEMFTVLFGHSSSLHISDISDVTEIGIVKGLVDWGLFQWLVFFSLLLYPVALFLLGTSQEYRRYALPYVAAVGVGVLSLWHYGSLMRTTNVFVFLALYAQALQIRRRREPLPGSLGPTYGAIIENNCY